MPRLVHACGQQAENLQRARLTAHTTIRLLIREKHFSNISIGNGILAFSILYMK